MMAVLCFLGGDKTSATQHRQFGGMPLVLRRGECGHWRNSRIVAQDAMPGSQENTLSVAPGPVAKEQGVFLDRSGQGISEDPLDVGDEVLVASENPIEEFQPLWTGFPGADGRHFGDEVPPVMRAHLPGLQINGAGRGIEQPRVPIPVPRLRCVLTVCPGKAFDGGNRLGARHHSRELLRAIALQNFAGGFSDQAPGVVRHHQRLVRLPSLAIPDQPPAPGIDESQVIPVAGSETVRQGLVRIIRRSSRASVLVV